ncbi:MAG: hypothetical protein IJS12_02330, partial [Lachnospiraceae bacterium]|nr:hypothetical protein [Lachnospiraceae bacterium]
MKSKNIPKCIREGIFCMMTGAMVFAGSTMVAEAAENETSMDTTGPDPEQVADNATDLDYGVEENKEVKPEVQTDYSTTSETITTYTEDLDASTGTSSETVVTYTETTYDVTNGDYCEMRPTDDFAESVASGEVTEPYAVRLDADGNIQYDANGEVVKVPVSQIPSMNIDEGGYFYFKDGDNDPDPYYTNETTTETTVTTDSKEVAEAIKADIEQEMADQKANQNGVDGQDANGDPSNTVTETDSRFNTTKKVITLSVSDIETTAYINTTDADGNVTGKTDVTQYGVTENDSFTVTTSADGQTVTVTKTTTTTDSEGNKVTTETEVTGDLYDIIVGAAQNKAKTYYLDTTTGKIQTDGNNSYEVVKEVAEDGTVTTTVTKTTTKADGTTETTTHSYVNNETVSAEDQIILDNTDTKDIKYVIAGTDTGIKASDLENVDDLKGIQFSVSYEKVQVNGNTSKEETVVTYKDKDGVEHTLTGSLADTIAEKALEGKTVASKTVYTLGEGNSKVTLSENEAFDGIENVTFVVNTDTGVVTYVNSQNETVTVTTSLAQKLVDYAKANGGSTQTRYNLDTNEITNLENDGWTVIKGTTDTKTDLTEAQKDALDSTWITSFDHTEAKSLVNLTEVKDAEGNV